MHKLHNILWNDSQKFIERLIKESITESQAIFPHVYNVYLSPYKAIVYLPNVWYEDMFFARLNLKLAFLFYLSYLLFW